MRDYLKNFLIDYNYADSDAKFLINLYDTITNNRTSFSLLNKACELYLDCDNFDFDKCASISKEIARLINVSYYSTDLLLLVLLSFRAKKFYIQKNISDKIFYDTMLDIRYKLEECKLCKGVIGTFVFWWFNGYFNLKRFAFGRLQFEIKELPEDFVSKDVFLPKGSKVINTHIPRSGMPLDEDSCNQSFLMAKNFFRDEFNSQKVPFICHTWLFYSGFVNLLQENTNLYKFCKRFTIYKEDETSGQDLWRFFDTEEKDFKKLPTNTSLRKRYVEYLLNGGKTGSGLGIYFY